MKEMFKDLLNVLEKEFGLYSNLYDLSCEEQKILIKGDVKKLQENLHKKEEIIFSLKNLEKERETLREGISRSLNINTEELNLSKIVEISEEFSEYFKNLQEKFLNILNNLKKIQNVNKELLNSSLSIIDFSLRLFTDVDSFPVYDEKGEDKLLTENVKILNKKV